MGYECNYSPQIGIYSACEEEITQAYQVPFTEKIERGEVLVNYVVYRAALREASHGPTCTAGASKSVT